MSLKVYKIIQDKFINSIQDVIDGKEKLLPWQKSWVGTMPINYVTRRPYSGVNTLLLEGGEWLTFNQIKELSKKDSKIRLKKGSKGSMIVFWKIVEKENEEKETESFPMLRYYYVYSASDVDGIESKLPINKTNTSLEEVDKVVDDYILKEGIKLDIREGSNRAFYQPASDRIVVPNINQFKSSRHYYRTLFHELTHSTGHESRLKRFNSNRTVNFGSEDYSKEELVAEIGSQMILGHLNINEETIHENSLTYVYGWMKVIKEDISLIISASSQAQKASDYILGKVES